MKTKPPFNKNRKMKFKNETVFKADVSIKKSSSETMRSLKKIF